MDDEEHRAALVALYASDSDSPSDIELLNFNPFGMGLSKSKKPGNGTSASSGTRTVPTTASKKRTVTKKRTKKKVKKNTLKKHYRVNHNFQGINEKLCRHVPAETRGKVFVPEDYGPPPLSKKLFTEYCAECCLQPCCMEEFSGKILSEGIRLRGFERFHNSTIQEALQGYIHQWLKPVFPASYWRHLKKATPSCITAKLSVDYPDEESNYYGSSSEDDEEGDEEEF